MIRFKVNEKEVEVAEGAYLFKALQALGHDIPHLCYYEGLEHYTSCMLCLVKDARTGTLIPSCSLKVQPGMEIITDDEEVFEARKTGLELLLSDHVGDCEAPCTKACPAHMDIPRMNRKLQKGEINEALEIVLKDIALPGVLGRICSAPCEKICRRKDIDEPVSICLLKRYAGDFGLYEISPPAHPDPGLQGKQAAIIGSGPAGLAAAYHAQLRGIQCTIFDKEAIAGGQLRAIDDAILPNEVLDKEIEFIKKSGIHFRLGEEINQETFLRLRTDFDAVVIATGPMEEPLRQWGVETYKQGIQVNKHTYETNLPGVFAIGSVLKPMKMAVKSLGHGKEASFCVAQYLKGEEVKGEPGIFNSRFGRILPEEVEEFLKESTDHHRIEPIYGRSKGLKLEEVAEEAARCLHCDCRKIEACKLRLYADVYRADQKRFGGEARKVVKKVIENGPALYEPEKCVKCGICVRLTARHQEAYGMTFIGKGFEIEIGIPFNEELRKGFDDIAEEVIRACPTGALAFRVTDLPDQRPSSSPTKERR
ncbi:MAG: (2Fe-2S)-binding protein [Phaeodactylibacter sp.]|nr:(2Fe-2S)-binding protein [Phaeodactylibacter sp.]MCB9054151.1 (2Fe-2S)-binding protein [Lewinellaceae bacterium]